MENGVKVKFKGRNQRKGPYRTRKPKIPMVGVTVPRDTWEQLLVRQAGEPLCATKKVRQLIDEYLKQANPAKKGVDKSSPFF